MSNGDDEINRELLTATDFIDLDFSAFTVSLFCFPMQKLTPGLQVNILH
jgi:hypothetical protein